MARVVWITGASSGIGRALALEYGRNGFDLALTARREDKLASLRDELEALGRKVAVCPADVTDAASVAAIPEQVAARLGGAGIDTAIANAGVIKSGPMSKLSAEDEAWQIDVNVKGVIHTVKAVLPQMRARGAGRLAVVASIAGRAPLPGRAAYVASKSAATYYLDSIRLELFGTGVTTTVVQPGYVESEMTAGVRSRMPFFWDAERAARVIYKGIESGKRHVRFPWQLHAAISLANALPAPIREAILKRQVVVRD